MTTNHKPVTALPWQSRKGRIDTLADNRAALAVTGTSSANHQDAAYIAHSANAYPRLVEAAKNLTEFWTNNTPVYPGSDVSQDILDILRELGEL